MLRDACKSMARSSKLSGMNKQGSTALDYPLIKFCAAGYNDIGQKWYWCLDPYYVWYYSTRGSIETVTTIPNLAPLGVRNRGRSNARENALNGDDELRP
jgi:hypothetical protein